MAMPYFLWNGIDSREMGLIVERYPNISRAKERVESITVPGRAGTLTLLEGDDVYEDVLYSLVAIITPEANLQAVIKWLKGSGTVVFGNDDGYSREARIINQIDFAKLINAGHREFTIPFACGPFKSRYPADLPYTVTTQPTTHYNDADVASYPLITIVGHGGIALTIGDITIAVQIPVVEETVDDVTTDYSGIIIDCESELATDLRMTTNYNNRISGDRQIIPVGEYSVSWELAETDTELTSVTIDERRRWL